MIFEIGKCYRHTTGEEIKIVGEVDSTLYGKCFVAESNKDTVFRAAGNSESYAVNWIEIAHDEWMKNFS